jgi:Tol biopolymer transport system component
MKKLLLITSTIILMLNCNAQVDSMYFGQTPPGDTAVIFAPGIISLTNRLEGKIIFSPDGNECYFDVSINGSDKIYYTKRLKNSWTEQAEAPFSKNYNTCFPFFSADGNRLYFNYYNDIMDDIWMVERTAGEWGDPQCLPLPINSSSADESYTETNDGLVYFWSQRPGGFGSDIWFKRPSSNQAENLGPPVNSTSTALDPCISPDGSYLIFKSYRSNKYGFYISFNTGNNVWTEPVNMEKNGAGINISGEISPSLSPDGKYLFFARHNAAGKTSDIYWVSTSIIDTLRKIAMPTVSVKNTILQGVKLYPNPTSGQFTISFGSNPIEEALVTISNLQGTDLFTNTIENTSSATIDLTGHPTGIYLVKVIADGACYVEKICLE